MEEQEHNNQEDDDLGFIYAHYYFQFEKNPRYSKSFDEFRAAFKKKSKYSQLLHCFHKKVKIIYINETTVIERELKIPTVKENDNFFDSVIFA